MRRITLLCLCAVTFLGCTYTYSRDEVLSLPKSIKNRNAIVMPDSFIVHSPERWGIPYELFGKVEIVDVDGDYNLKQVTVYDRYGRKVFSKDRTVYNGSEVTFKRVGD